MEHLIVFQSIYFWIYLFLYFRDEESILLVKLSLNNLLVFCLNKSQIFSMFFFDLDDLFYSYFSIKV
jgi:hypothetical protein